VQELLTTPSAAPARATPVSPTAQRATAVRPTSPALVTSRPAEPTASGRTGTETTGTARELAAPDAAALDVPAESLAAAERITYRVRQRFRYTYDGPATHLVHRLVVLPPRRHGDQARRYGELAVSAPGAHVTWQRGPDGLCAATVTLAEVPAVLDFDVVAVVDRGTGAGWPTLPASALTGRRLLAPTPLTRSDETVRAVAGRLAGTDPLATARRCREWVHEHIAYRPGSTDVGTTVAEVIRGGSGVCQDQAHVMIALCRAAGVPARYVLGHLLGEGDSHAWVEVVVPGGWAPRPPGGRAGDRPGHADGTAGVPGAGAVAVAMDPCHDRLADRRYVTVAVGRDYLDVAPTSGWYAGSGRGLLTATQRVDVVDVVGGVTGPAAPPSAAASS
jgi:transglutaminase-like putative cysteine protease